jgi:hypothetical protein
VLAIMDMVFAWASLPRSQPMTVKKPPPIFAFFAVVRDRDTAVLIFGYAAAIWGSVGLRQWIVVFLAFCASAPGLTPAPEWSMLATGAAINLLGVPAGLLGNELSIRFGLRKVALVVFLASAIVTGLFGLTATLPYVVVIWLALGAGFIVQGNFANLTTGLLAVTARSHAGATVALYSCVGFGGGFLGTVAFGAALDWSGGASQPLAWVVSFASCGLVCLAASAATAFLSRDIGQPRN